MRRTPALLLTFALLLGDLAPALAGGIGKLLDALADGQIERTVARAASAAGDSLGTVTASALNLRTGIWGEILRTIPRGESVTITGQRNGWYSVRTADGQTGWVSGRYIRKGGGSGSSGVTTGSGGGTSGLPTGTTPPGTGRVLRVRTTGYYPPPAGGYKSKAEERMEGGALDCRGKPLRTLQDYTPGSYVSCATDPRVIKTGTYFTIDSYPGILFLACDVGGGVKGNHIDICVKDKAASYRVTGSATVRLVQGK